MKELPINKKEIGRRKGEEKKKERKKKEDKEAHLVY